MNCEEFELGIRDLARNHAGDRNVEEPPASRDHVQALVHVSTCKACERRLQDERVLSRTLDVLATEMMSLAPSAQIEAKLLQAFRQTVAPSAPLPPATSPLFARAIGRKAYWLTAAAAMLLIVLGIVLVRAKLPGVQPGLATEQAKAPARDSTPVPIAGPRVEKAALPGPESVSPLKDNHEMAVHQRHRKPRRVIAQAAKRDDDARLAISTAAPQSTEAQAEPEVTTQFIALSYVAPANLQEGGQIVRVELPRSAMASFGLPVNMDRLGERVKADVLLSADGFARAIRFVQ